MKTILLGLVLLASAIHSVHAQGYRWDFLRPADAIAVVQHFENDPHLQGEVSMMPGSSNWEPDEFAESGMYRITTPRYEYTVSKYTRDRITRWDNLFVFDKSHFYSEPYDPEALALKAMSEETAFEIARNFVRQHYPRPQELNVRHTRLHRADKITGNRGEDDASDFVDSYEFTFMQNCGQGILGPDYCFVSVDSIYGKVVKYIQIYYPVYLNARSRLNSQQAITSALRAAQLPDVVNGKVERVYISRPDAMGAQTIIYRLSLANARGQTYSLNTDGLNGRILRWNSIQNLNALPRPAHSKDDGSFPQLTCRLHGQAVPLLYPPLLIHEKPYLYLGALAYGAADSKLRYTNPHRIRLTAASRRLAFDTASRQFVYNGKRHTLSSTPRLVAGRCYVPLEAAQIVLPNLHYARDSREIEFASVP